MSGYFYLEVDLGGVGDSEALGARRLVEEAAAAVFGSAGAAALAADVVRARTGRALLRLRGTHLRRLRAALALSPKLRVLSQASSLQALL